jgi:hypothetical protein
VKFTGQKYKKHRNTCATFDGIYLANREFAKTGLEGFMDKEPGTGGKRGRYTYGNLFQTRMTPSGGECAEDLRGHLRIFLKRMSGNPVPGADTPLRGVKELATEHTEVIFVTRSHPVFCRTRFSIHVNPVNK